MKAILTLLFILTLGAFALANTGEQHVQSSLIQIDFTRVSDGDSTGDTKKASSNSDSEVARLYRRENTLVKKALLFSTKRTRAKLA